MFTCKDCVHYDACKDMYNGYALYFNDCDFTPDCIDMGLFKNKADVVEVVRCKDCQHFDGEGCLKTHGEFEPNPTDYCSYGERRCEE